MFLFSSVCSYTFIKSWMRLSIKSGKSLVIFCHFLLGWIQTLGLSNHAAPAWTQPVVSAWFGCLSLQQKVTVAWDQIKYVWDSCCPEWSFLTLSPARQNERSSGEASRVTLVVSGQEYSLIVQNVTKLGQTRENQVGSKQVC